MSGRLSLLAEAWRRASGARDAAALPMAVNGQA